MRYLRKSAARDLALLRGVDLGEPGRQRHRRVGDRPARRRRCAGGLRRQPAACGAGAAGCRPARGGGRLAGQPWVGGVWAAAGKGRAAAAKRTGRRRRCIGSRSASFEGEFLSAAMRCVSTSALRVILRRNHAKSWRAAIWVAPSGAIGHRALACRPRRRVASTWEARVISRLRRVDCARRETDVNMAESGFIQRHRRC